MITVQRARELRAMIEKAAGAGLDDKDGSTAAEVYPAEPHSGALLECGIPLEKKSARKRAARRTPSRQEYNTAESSIVAYKRTRRKAIGLRRSPPLFGAE